MACFVLQLSGIVRKWSSHIPPGWPSKHSEHFLFSCGSELVERNGYNRSDEDISAHALGMLKSHHVECRQAFGLPIRASVLVKRNSIA